MARLNIGKHLLEAGAVEVCARRPIVDISIIDNEIRLVRKEIIQHQLLVFYGTAPLLLSSTERRIYSATCTYKDGAGMGANLCFLLFLAI